jgi:hypothetical protein
MAICIDRMRKGRAGGHLQHSHRGTNLAPSWRFRELSLDMLGSRFERSSVEIRPKREMHSRFHATAQGLQ